MRLAKFSEVKPREEVFRLEGDKRGKKYGTFCIMTTGPWGFLKELEENVLIDTTDLCTPNTKVWILNEEEIEKMYDDYIKRVEKEEKKIK